MPASLNDQMAEFRNEGIKQLPTDIAETMDAETAKLAASDLAAKAVQKGDQLADATLQNHLGNQANLHELLKDGPLVINFYRGGWCPFCNFELKALQAELPAIKELGAQLVAISPELPDASLTTAEKNALTFPVLSDPNAEYARQLGLVFTLPEVLRPIYSSFGIELSEHNGSKTFDLPIAATYVVNQEGTIVASFLDADYTKRMEPSDVIQALKAI